MERRKEGRARDGGFKLFFFTSPPPPP